MEAVSDFISFGIKYFFLMQKSHSSRFFPLLFLFFHFFFLYTSASSLSPHWSCPFIPPVFKLFKSDIEQSILAASQQQLGEVLIVEFAEKHFSFCIYYSVGCSIYVSVSLLQHSIYNSLHHNELPRYIVYKQYDFKVQNFSINLNQWSSCDQLQLLIYCRDLQQHCTLL